MIVFLIIGFPLMKRPLVGSAFRCGSVSPDSSTPIFQNAFPDPSPTQSSTPAPTLSSNLAASPTSTPTTSPTPTPIPCKANASGDSSISGTVFGLPMTIRTSNQFAGAIYSLTWAGKEFINHDDHGRELQSAISFDGYGECLNPTEAGHQ
ncbi:MAG: hypothetical protein JWQ35_330 [Bacteriovoracaceae bacterium]|nr:hypothetical protein [Bacteriovoracaceae bacterium]